MSSVSEYIKNHSNGSSTLKSLPLMHSCDGYDASIIIHNKSLSIGECPGFVDEELLRLFYGKPVYRELPNVSEKVTGEAFLPVCFIIPFDKIDTYKVLPFDAGIFPDLVRNGFFHNKMNIKDFELDTGIEEIKRYIEVFFTNNYNYMRGKASEVKDVGDFYVDGLIQIHNIVGHTQFDEKTNTIEVVTKNEVSVSDVIECIIMPEPLSRDSKIKPFIHNHSNIDYRYYDVPTLSAPCMYNAVVYQKVMDYFREKEII